MQASSGGADFSADSIGLVVIKAAVILVFLLLSVLFALWFERRIIGRFQERLGPDGGGRVGGGGRRAPRPPGPEPRHDDEEM